MHKLEIVKQLVYCFEEMNLRVKAIIYKSSDGYYEFSLSHYYRPEEGASTYYPSCGDSSLSLVEAKLEYYMSNFSADYIENKDF